MGYKWRRKTPVIQVGYDNYVSLDGIKAVGHPRSAPIDRMVQGAKKKGLVMDFTAGRRCKGILLLDTGHIVLSFLSSDTLARRYREERARREREVRRSVPGNPGNGGGVVVAQMSQ